MYFILNITKLENLNLVSSVLFKNGLSIFLSTTILGFLIFVFMPYFECYVRQSCNIIKHSDGDIHDLSPHTSEPNCIRITFFFSIVLKLNELM